MKTAAPDVSAGLTRHAAQRPDQPAVIHKTRTVSFADLEAEVSVLAAGLRALGLEPGARVALLVPPGPEFVALSFALFRAGLVPVLIDPGIGAKNFGRCLSEAEPVAFIGSPKALAARAAFGWGKASLKLFVRASGLWPGAVSPAKLRALGAKGLPAAEPVDESEPAAILFTSGSTGAPKGAVYTRGMFDAQVRLLSELFSIAPGEVSVPTFPLFGLFDVALGQTIVVPDMDSTRPADVDPREIIDCVERHGASQLFGSPALLETVVRYGEAMGVKLPSLKRVLSAGAPVSWRTLKRLSKLLPEGCPIFTPYGATEALPVALISSREVLEDTAGGSAQGKGTCVGRPVPGAQVSVIRVTDEPIERWSDDLLAPEGEIGEIAVSGPMVSASYWNRPKETRLAKIARDGAVVHRMGDTGYFDAKGRLWFCGRKSQRVRLADRTLFTVACEGVFNAHPWVRRSALVGVEALGRRLPVLCVELEPAARGQENRLRQELLDLAQRNELTKPIGSVLFHPKFPVDIRHNAKIFREKLAVWAAEELNHR